MDEREPEDEDERGRETEVSKVQRSRDGGRESTGTAKSGATIGDGLPVEDDLTRRVIGAAIEVHRRLAPVHQAQLISYLRTHGLRLGLLLNFNVPVLKHGIDRILNPQVRNS